MRMRTRLSGKLKRGVADQDGVAAIELALVAPLIVALLAGTADLGGMVLTRFTLNNAVTAASHYALANGGKVTSADGAQLASTIAALVSDARGPAWANALVVVNNGPANSTASGVATTSGAASNADQFWCPTRSGATIAWGAAMTSGAACSSGGKAGKFVQITGSRTYSTLILPAAFLDGPIKVTAVVQVQ